jgi:hypothetical protein
MPTLRLRVTGSDDDTNQLMHALEAIEGIERVEEVADLMPHMDDEDSSSAGLPDDLGPGLHNIEVEAPNDEGVRRIHVVVERMAVEAELAVEFIEDF